MRDKVYSVKEIKKRLAPVFKSHKVKKAVLFGSYAQGDATPDSDVDIYVDSSLRGLSFIELVEDVRDALRKDVDVIDRREIDEGTRIEAEIKKWGVVIYEE